MDDFERLITSRGGMNSLIGEHWMWGGAKNDKGYGHVRVNNGRTVGVHRVSFEHFHRLLLSGEEVRHTCDIRACFRPSHLLAGTHADNMLDMATRCRSRTTSLTPDQVREICAKYWRSIPRVPHHRGGGFRSNIVALSEEYGVSVAALQHILVGRNWKWLD